MKTAATIIVSLLSLLCCMAQDAKPVDPPELATCREEHVRNLQRVSIPVLQQYLRTLEGLKLQFTREARYDALDIVQIETKKVQQELDAANKAVSRSNTTSLQLTILSAIYGELGKKQRTQDITEQLRKALRVDQEIVKLNNELIGNNDPAPYTSKQTKIIYTIDGQRKEKVFPEGYSLNLKDLK